MCASQMLAALASGRCCRFVLSNDLADDRHQLDGNFYNGSASALEGSFVFSDSFLLRLSFVVGKNSTHSFFIPTWWKTVVRHFCLLRLRRRYAAKAFPRNSYAVITKTLSGSGSGT